MKALVTGASGFLGRNLVQKLLAEGYEVVATHRRPQPPFHAPHLHWSHVDLGNPIDWHVLLDGVDLVYHLAWSTLPQSANADPTADALENIGGSVRLLDALRQRPGCRIVFASSGGTVYGRTAAQASHEDDPKQPVTAYGVSKLAVESYLAHFHTTDGLDYAVLRLANPYGPDQEHGRNFGVIATFVARALSGEACAVYGDGRTERDFIYVDDAVSAFLAVARGPLRHRIYNIGSGKGRSIGELVTAIETGLGQSILVRHEPARDFDAPRSVLDTRRAADDLAWTAQTSFEAGLNRVIDAHRSRREAR